MVPSLRTDAAPGARLDRAASSSFPDRSEWMTVPNQRESPDPIVRRESPGPLAKPVTPRQGHDDGIDWTALGGALRRRKLLLLVVLLMGSVIGFGISRTVEPTYVTEARFWIDDPAPTGPELGPIQLGHLLETTAWMELLRSYRVLDAVVREHRLQVTLESDADPSFLAGLTTDPDDTAVVPGGYVVERSRSGDSFRLISEREGPVDTAPEGEPLGAALGFRWTPPESALAPGERVRFTVRTVRETSAELAEELASAMDLNGNFLRVGLRGNDPVQVAGVLNGIAERFVALAGELKSANLTERTAILEEQLAAARARLDASDASLEAFRAEAIVLPGELAIERGAGAGSGVRDTYFTLEMERDDLARTRDALQGTLALAGSDRFPIETLEAIPMAAGSTEISSLLEELAERRAELRSLRNRYSDDHRDVQAAARAIETLEGRVLPAAVERLEGDLARRIASLDEQLADRSGALTAIPARVREEARRSRDLELAEALYTTLQQRYEEARLAEASSIPDIRILDAAAVPTTPDSNDGPRVMLIAMMASLGLGLVGAVIADRTDRRIRTPDEITRGMGLNILGAIPRVKARKKEEGRRMAMEAFRSLSVNLTHSYGTAGPMILAVTSPDLGDGKSFVTVNLAGALARQGLRTAVVDGDTRRGVLHQLLGKERRPGLTDHLAGEATWESILQPVVPDTLDLVASGTRRESGPELLTSATARDLMSRLKADYEVVLIDTPPLKAGADAMILSTLAGHMLFVLRTGATARDLAEANLEQLDRLPVRVLGAVLNDISSNGGLFQGYTYAASYGATDEQDSPDAPRLAGVGRQSGA